MPAPPDPKVPTVSVVMPVYNAAPFVQEAIRSVLDQTFTDLELIIINDGSTDDSAALIKAFHDPRIRYAEQANQGVVKALNAGMALARGEFIARQDADDVSEPTRLQQQVDRFRSDHRIGLLGTWAVVTDQQGRTIGKLHHPTQHARITYALIWDSAFVHPTVMFRRDLLGATGPYSTDPKIFEDHAMWNRMVQLTGAANLPEELLRYREVPISASRTTGREVRTVEQRERNIRRLVPQASERMIALLARSGIAHPSVTTRELVALRAMLRTIVAKCGGDAADQRYMKTDAQARLMGYRVVAGSDLLSRALDRLWKGTVLIFARK